MPLSASHCVATRRSLSSWNSNHFITNILKDHKHLAAGGIKEARVAGIIVPQGHTQCIHVYMIENQGFLPAEQYGSALKIDQATLRCNMWQGARIHFERFYSHRRTLRQYSSYSWP